VLFLADGAHPLRLTILLVGESMNPFVVAADIVGGMLDDQQQRPPAGVTAGL